MFTCVRASKVTKWIVPHGHIPYRERMQEMALLSFNDPAGCCTAMDFDHSPNLPKIPFWYPPLVEIWSTQLDLVCFFTRAVENFFKTTRNRNRYNYIQRCAMKLYLGPIFLPIFFVICFLDCCWVFVCYNVPGGQLPSSSVQRVPLV